MRRVLGQPIQGSRILPVGGIDHIDASTQELILQRRIYTGAHEYESMAFGCGGFQRNRGCQLNTWTSTLFRALMRAVLLLAGLIFLTSLLAAGTILMLIWLLRALWARLTGQQISPWTFRVDRQAVWSRFYRPPQQRGPHAAKDNVDVVDVQAKEVKPRED